MVTKEVSTREEKWKKKRLNESQRTQGHKQELSRFCLRKDTIQLGNKVFLHLLLSGFLKGGQKNRIR